MTSFLSMNQISVGKYSSHIFIHLLDVDSFSFTERGWQCWYISLLVCVFLWWFPFTWYSLNLCIRFNTKAQLRCSLKSNSQSGSSVFWPGLWVGCRRIFRNESFLSPFAFLIDTVSVCGPFPLAASSWLRGLIPPMVPTPYLFVLLTPHWWLPADCACCVCVLWGNVHVWLLCLILNLRWTSGGFLLFIKNDFG